MSQTLYTNQFKQSAVIGQLDLESNPNPFVDTVRFDPTETSTTTIYEAEGVTLKDLGASDVNAAGVPVVSKRPYDYSRLFGVKIFNIKKNNNTPNDTFDIARKGSVMYLQCGEAITRGTKVALRLSAVGKVYAVTTGYAEVGVALDKGTTNDVIRVELTCDDTAVAAT